MVKEKEVKTIGKCDQLIVDFCSRESGTVVLSLMKNNCIQTSIEMDVDKVNDFINLLKNPLPSSMTELSDGRQEKRQGYRYVFATRSSIGITKDGMRVKIVMQLDGDDIQVGSVDMSETGTKVLIGILYLWLGNNFLSSRTIHSLFSDNLLQSNDLKVINVRLPVDCL